MKLTDEQKQNITNEYNQWKDRQYAGKTIEQRKELDAFFTPPELTIQMIETFDSIENKSILDPTAGAGGLIAACILAGADPKLCYCNELDEDILKICKERLIPMGVPEENIHQGNALDPRCIEKKIVQKRIQDSKENQSVVIMDTYVNHMNKILEEIKNKNITPNLLLHSCCAPCSSTCIEQLTDYFNITVFYYNPNIEPLDEYLKRKEEQKSFIQRFPHKNKIDIVDCDYDNKSWHHFIRGFEKCGEGSERCYRCYVFRLEETAKQTKLNKFDYFATTLTLSPYKNIKWLNEIGFELAQKYNVKYLPSHFGADGGVDRSCELSNQYGLYQQNYCGCVYSKIENSTMEQVFDTMEKTNITYKI